MNTATTPTRAAILDANTHEGYLPVIFNGFEPRYLGSIEPRRMASMAESADLMLTAAGLSARCISRAALPDGRQFICAHG